MAMGTGSGAARPSKAAFWTGWILSVAVAPLLAFSALMKFMPNEEVAKGFEHLGWPLKLAVPLGILELACVVVYLIPRTAVVGAILLTGYMGGAIATHVRLEEPFIVQAGLAVVAWLGLYLREPRLRALIPIRL
ncbi:MAG: DoxX family protein [Phycisphaeraceae bacterium]|nr:DoxX family protein [Phycisphaeraceae bacterium]